MNELEQFNKLLSQDPSPGTKDRAIREGNMFKIPGWVFGVNEDYLDIPFKHVNRRMIKIGFSGQILYDILVLGLTNIDQRPKCPVCQDDIKFRGFGIGYNITCGSKTCISKLAKEQVTREWTNKEYRERQTESHKEWSKNHFEQASYYSKKNWENKEYRERQTESHTRKS